MAALYASIPTPRLGRAPPAGCPYFPGTPRLPGMSPREHRDTPRDASTDLSRAVEALLTQWGAIILRTARRYGLSAAELDEVQQDVRLRFWSLLQRNAGRGPEVNASYAAQAAMSAAVDLVRRDRMGRSTATDPARLEATDHRTNPHDLTARLEEALLTIMPSRRVAVRLHLDGRSLDEIARILRWTPAQARNQVYRGLADLKAHLSDPHS